MTTDFYDHPDLYDVLLPVGAHLPFYADLARQQAGPVLGWTSAVAAYGAFIAPVVIGAQITAGTPEIAMYGFAVFYALCLGLNWWFYLRANAYVKNP